MYHNTNHLHHPLAMEAMKRGVSAMCEAARAKWRTVEGDAHTTQAHNLVHRVNFSVRAHSGVQYLRQCVRDGVIGQYLEGRFEYSGDYGLSGSPGWRGSVSEAGAGGVLQDLGSHVIDLAQHIIGDRITAVSASARCLEAGRLVDFNDRMNRDQAADSVYVQAQFAGGGHGDLQMSWVRPQGNAGNNRIGAVRHEGCPAVENDWIWL